MWKLAWRDSHPKIHVTSSGLKLDPENKIVKTYRADRFNNFSNSKPSSPIVVSFQQSYFSCWQCHWIWKDYQEGYLRSIEKIEQFLYLAIWVFLDNRPWVFWVVHYFFHHRLLLNSKLVKWIRHDRQWPFLNINNFKSVIILSVAYSMQRTSNWLKRFFSLLCNQWSESCWINSRSSTNNSLSRKTTFSHLINS